MFPANSLAPGQSGYRYAVQFSEFFAVDDVVGRPGAALPLRIRLPQTNTEAFRFVMVRQLPEDFKLSAGFGTRSYWVVALGDVFGLTVKAPPTAQGTFEFDVLLFRGEGTEPERRKTKIVLESDLAAEAPRQRKPQTGGATATFAANAPLPPGIEPVNGVIAPNLQPAPEITLEDRSILVRGNKFFEEGNIINARLFFQHLAKRGVSAGALAMAQTYDPKFLDELGVRGGVRPDPAEAKKWYELASKLALDRSGSRQSAGR